METLYNAHPVTGEYLRKHDSSPRENPMWNFKTHSFDDRWLYNSKTSSLLPPPETGKHEVAVLENSAWVVKPDYRGEVFFDTLTQERHEVSEIGIEPSPTWTEKAPFLNSVWNGNEWKIDLGLWLNNEVRPERDRRLAACDYVMMSDYPIDPAHRAGWEAYRARLRDLPATLTAVTDSVPWPPVPG